jgi:hypothetical protein
MNSKIHGKYLSENGLSEWFDGDSRTPVCCLSVMHNPFGFPNFKRLFRTEICFNFVSEVLIAPTKSSIKNGPAPNDSLNVCQINYLTQYGCTENCLFSGMPSSPAAVEI